MKKISLIVTSLIFCIAAVFIFPAKEANANPIAVGGALYLGGAGVYVLGAIAVGGIVGVAGCTSCQEDIEAHAQRTWEGSTQLAKDGLQAMIDGSIALGNGIAAMNSDFSTWVDSIIDNYAKSVSITGGNSANLSDVIYYQDSTSESVRGGGDGTTNLNIYANGYHVHSVSVDPAWYITLYLVGGGQKSITATYSSYSEYSSSVGAMNSPETFQTTMAKYGLAVNYVNMAGHQAIQAGISGTKEAWQDMKDAGLVLPTDNARPMHNDVPLTYNPSNDTYAGIDGITVPHEDVTGFEYQKPHWKTADDLAALGIAGAGAGLYIDGWETSDSITSTYDPVADVTTTVTSGTTTNVTTGETAITTTTTTTTGDTTGNPPVDPPPVTPPKTGEPINPFKGVVPGASILSLFQLLVAIIWYLIRMFTFVATIAFIAPTPIDNPYFMWFTTATFYGITPFPLVQNLALFFLGFSIYKSIRRVF